MTQEDIILLIADGAEGPFGLDPVRMMKSTFVAAERGPGEWRGLFRFQPYNYGPFDASVYGARDVLVARGLLAVDRSGKYEKYSLTPAGRRRVVELESEHGARVTSWLRRVGAYVSSKPFAQLLRQIYAAYPEYRQRSVFTG